MGFYNKHNNSTPEPDDILTISIDPHQSMDILLNNGIIIKSQYFEEFYIRYTYKSFMRKVKLERILKNE